MYPCVCLLPSWEGRRNLSTEIYTGSEMYSTRQRSCPTRGKGERRTGQSATAALPRLIGQFYAPLPAPRTESLTRTVHRVENEIFIWITRTLFLLFDESEREGGERERERESGKTSAPTSSGFPPRSRNCFFNYLRGG